jgi:hypothetical protein
MQRTTCCRIFTPALPEYPAASGRDYCSGAYTRAVSAAQSAVDGGFAQNTGRSETAQPTGHIGPKAGPLDRIFPGEAPTRQLAFERFSAGVQREAGIAVAIDQ